MSAWSTECVETCTKLCSEVKQRLTAHSGQPHSTWTQADKGTLSRVPGTKGTAVLGRVSVVGVTCVVADCCSEIGVG